MDRGKYFIDFELVTTSRPCAECKLPPGFKSIGHFEVKGNVVRLFNDPNCTDVVGPCEWEVSNDALSFEVVEDKCPFVHLRAKYLTAAPCR
jgi:hypothetical protein